MCAVLYEFVFRGAPVIDEHFFGVLLLVFGELWRNGCDVRARQTPNLPKSVQERWFSRFICVFFTWPKLIVLLICFLVDNNFKRFVMQINHLRFNDILEENNKLAG